MNRRTVLIAAAAAAALPAFALAAEQTDAVTVFEADEPAARAFARSRTARLAVDGDRVRFGRKLFREARPAKVVAMTRYADYLVLAESAREEGYRTALIDPASPKSPALFTWTAERA